MAYVPTVNDPKIVSIQSFRTSNNLFIRITSKALHGWDHVLGVSFKNKLIPSYVVKETTVKRSGLSTVLIELSSSVSRNTSSSIVTLKFESGYKYDTSVSFEDSEIPVTYEDLIFNDFFSEGAINNTYDYNFSIQHSSSTLRNSLRTFIYPLAIKDPSRFLHPTVRHNQYYISNTATSLYVASSSLQNSYYSSLNEGTLTSTKELWGKFKGGEAHQEVNFTCSTGAKSDGVNVITGNVIALNLQDIYTTTDVYSVCTQENASNYYRDSPYTACDGQTLSASIIDDLSNVFVEGGCCLTSRSVDQFSYEHEIRNATEALPTSGQVSLTIFGGKTPFDVTISCASDDATCVTYSVTASAAVSHTLAGLSGSASSKYSLTIIDDSGARLSGQFGVSPAPSVLPGVGCGTSGAINGNALLGAELSVGSLCRWCDNSTGHITSTEDTFTGDYSAWDLGITSSDVTGAFGNTNGSVSLTWAWESLTVATSDSTYNYNYGNSPLFAQGDGSESWTVERRTLTYAHYTADVTYESERFELGVGGVSVSPASLSTLAFTDSSRPTGFYIYKLSYSDTQNGGDLVNCSAFAKTAVKFTGCTDSTADNYDTNYTSNPNLFIADNSLCITTPPADIISALEDIVLTTAVESINNSPCEFRIKFMMSGGVEVVGWGQGPWGSPINIDDMPYALPAQVIQIAADEYSIPFGQMYIGNFTFTADFQTASAGTIDTITQSWTSQAWVPGGNTAQVVAFGTDPSNAALSVGVVSASISFPIYNGNPALDGVLLTTATLAWPSWLNPYVALDSEGILETFSDDALCSDCTTNSEGAVSGCTEITSCNYNSAALIDDGTCVNTLLADNNFGDGEVSVDIAGDGVLVTGNPCDCSDESLLGYSVVAAYYMEQNGNVPYMYADGTTTCGAPIVYGCTNNAYNEYNPAANVDDGSCVNTTISGCTDATACNYNDLANTDDGTCYSDAIGCEEFGTWAIQSYTTPNTCDGASGGANGALTLVNSSYYGPMSIGVWNVNYGATWVGYSSAATPALIYGVLDGQPLDYTQGTFLNTTNGYSSVMTVVQHPSIGTAITFSNVTAGPINIRIGYTTDVETIQEITMGIANDTCMCTAAVGGGPLLTNADDFTYITSSSDYTYTLLSPDGQRRDGSTGPCGCMDEASDTYSPTATVHTPGACLYYGCTDPEASNYSEIATASCTDPSNQSHDGNPCAPCIYGFVDSLYTPTFCMPTKVEQQIDIIHKCIGTAGTASYINTITGKSDCDFKKAWKLILIEYLMSKTGLDCVYNCADESTPTLGALKSCSDRPFRGNYTGNLDDGLSLSGNTSKIFFVGDTIHHRRSESGAYSIYTLTALPNGLQSITMYYEGYSGEGDTNYLVFGPSHSTGAKYWKLCEEPPSKPTTVNYIGKFTTFVQNYCRQCQIPVSLEDSESTVEIESVITVNGIVITVNNSDLK